MRAAVGALQPMDGLRVDVVALGVLVVLELVVAADQRPAREHRSLPAAHAALPCDRHALVLAVAELRVPCATERGRADLAVVDQPRAGVGAIDRAQHGAAASERLPAHQNSLHCAGCSTTATAWRGSAAAWNASSASSSLGCSARGSMSASLKWWPNPGGAELQSCLASMARPS